MSVLRWLGILGLLATGCGFLPPSEPPRVVAHRAAAGNWPENSRAAVKGAVARGYPGIEFDLVLTRDLVPVLSHDPWLNPALCTRADGSALPAERILIKDLSLDELGSGYRCGGIPDPASPGAEVVADQAMTLEELLSEAAKVPQMLLHFDLKYEAGLTAPAEVFADQIIDRWRAAQLPNPWYVTTTEPEAIPAFQAKGSDVAVMLTWPKFVAGESVTRKAITSELGSQIGLNEPIAQAKAAGAAGINIPYQVLDRRTVEAAKQEQLSIQVWTLNGAKELGAYCRWPVNVLITDYPERAPCL